MTICDGGGLHRAGRFAFEQLIVVSCGAADLRWALLALVLRSLGIAGANCRVLLIILVQSAAHRIARSGGFEARVDPADTTVAAGRG